MSLIRLTFQTRTIVPATGYRTRRPGSTRWAGAIMLGLAFLMAWLSNWFHVEKDVSGYPEIRLEYSRCAFETRVHGRSTTRQIAFFTRSGRYVLDQGVWGRHFKGPELANALAGGGTVRAWVHPRYPHSLRGMTGGKIDILPQWGLDFDRRNMRAGLCIDAIFAGIGLFLILLKRPTRSR